MNLKTQLEEAVKSQQIYSIFSIEDLDEGYTGFILRVKKKEILIRMINRDGREGGFFLGKVDDIICCCKGDMELQRRKMLWEENHELIQSLPIEGDNMTSAFFEYAKKKNELISVIYLGEEYSGSVRYFNDEIVIIKECTYYGESDGGLWLRREWVDAVKVKTPELRIRNKMNNLKNAVTERKTGENIYENLKLYEGTEEIFEFYIEEGLDTFYVGRVAFVTKEEIIISSIDCDGYDDGYAVFALDNMICVSRKSKYLRKIERIKKTKTDSVMLKIRGGIFNGGSTVICKGKSMFYYDRDKRKDLLWKSCGMG